MSAQLQQILAYLDQKDVNEVILSIGRKVAIRQGQGFSSLTAKPLTKEQLATLLRGTPLADLIPDDDTTAVHQVKLFGKDLRVQAGRQGDDVLLRIDGAPVQRVATKKSIEDFELDLGHVERRKKQTTSPRTKTATTSARTKSKTVGQRTKGSTNAPRSKGSTNAPRGKGQTSAPSTGRTRARSISPRNQRASSIPFDVEGFEIDVEATSAPPAKQTQGIAIGALGLVKASPATAKPGAHDVAEFDIDLGTQGGFEIDIGDVAETPRTRAGRKSEFELDASDLEPVDHNAKTVPIDIGFAKTMMAGVDARPAEKLGKGVLPAAPSRQSPLGDVARSRKASRQAVKPVGDLTFGDLVREAREADASDLHIASGRVVSIRVGGILAPLASAGGPLSVAAAESLLMPLLAPEHHGVFQRQGYIDLAVPAPGGGRLRANISKQQAGLKGTFRLALEQPATLEQLGLPKDLAKVVSHHQGLVVIAGPSGHGKTTTLAALVDTINATKPYHILTIEDPIEIVHPRKAAVVSQREAGRHTKSFAAALKASLREDPDVIVIGELRDRESVEIALTAAETGHLVISTMSTPSAAKTIDRLIDMFPPDEHTQVRASIAGALRAIVAQRLLPAKTGGVVAAVELVTGVLPLAVLIRDDKLYQLPNLMQRGRAFGMIRFDDSLLELVKAGKITEETALPFAENKRLFAGAMR